MCVCGGGGGNVSGYNIERSIPFMKSRVKAGRVGRPRLPVPNSPYGLCGREATFNLNHSCQIGIPF